TNVKTALRFKCKCKCGCVIRGMVERRQSLRKSVGLEGMLLFIDSYGRTNKQAVRINDISMTGLQISVDIKPEFAVGDNVIIIFRLNDREQTEIQENATVIRINANTAGLKFESSGLFGKLSFYLVD
ncbi:MAG: PilZ domain-containing protein, partial [Desulfosarcina sp.]